MAAGDARTIAFPGEKAANFARLAAFWPEYCLAPVKRADILAMRAEDTTESGRAGASALLYATGPLRAPAFLGRCLPVTLLPLAGLPPADPVPAARAAAVAEQVASLRIGGEPGLPEPSPEALRLPRRRAILVLDPCRRAQAASARAALASALDLAGGRPVILARDPAAPPGAPAQLAPPPGVHWLPERLSPWALLDLAEELRGASDEMALLASAAGVRVDGRLPDPVPRWAALVGALRCADPFLARPWPLERALEQLGEWRRAQAENRRVTLCLGMAFWKRRRVAALFAHAGGAPCFTRHPVRAVARARHAGGALAVWASRATPELRADCRRQGVTLLTVEDGFVRSRGLGARFLPGAAYAVDDRGIYYDPARESALEHLLATAEFPAPLLARAAALRQAIVARGVTKYNLQGDAPVIAAPPGRPRLLVPGQVEGDASVRLGGGAIQDNLALLRAVRAAHPDAFLIYKPHPDLEAGFRQGRLESRALAELADQVVTGAPLAALFPQIDALHTLTSLSGFEALLRGVRVVTWGQPFYAGWGLTEDRNPPPRRGRRLTLDELVAASLILFPRQVDPVTELPCPPEVILERLEDPAAWTLSPFTLHRGFEGWLRGALSRLRGLR